MEIWEPSIGDTSTNAVATGNVEDVSSTSLMPIEGWYYPDYVAETCPGLPDHKALHECALIAELKSAALTKQPYIMTFWRPHWVHSTYPGGWIDFPEHKPACTEDPKWGSNSKEVYDCGFANAWINKFTWAGTKDKWPGT